MVQTVGSTRTKDLVFTARTLNAAQALDMGILNYLVARENIDSETIGICRRMSTQSRASPVAAKTNVSALLSGTTTDGQRWIDDEDFHEGVLAFTQKRTAHF